MTRNKTVIGLLLLSLCAVLVLANGSRTIHATKTLTFSVRNDTDTLTVTPSTALDSFTYTDSLILAGGDTIVDTFTSPLWAIRLHVDSAVSAAYLCSLYVNGTKRAFTFTNAATIAAAVDSFVAKINGLAGVTDTVNAEDSGTYVYIRSLFGSLNTQIPPGRFYGVRGTSAARDLKIHFDTASVTTVAMVCDSLVARINADTLVNDSVTAIDQTTNYDIVSGVMGIPVPDFAGDSTQDTTNTYVWSTKYDSILIASTAQDDWFCNTYRGDILFSALDDTLRGVGDLDSIYIWVKSSWDSAGTKVFLTLDSAIGAFPGGLHFSKIYAAANDTLFRDALWLIYYIKDSTSDTTYTTEGTISIDALLKKE